MSIENVQHSSHGCAHGVAPPWSKYGQADLSCSQTLQWKWVDEQLGDFGNKDRNVRLGLVTGGMNFYGVKRSNCNTWPVCLLKYNVPSWLTIKKHFIMLSMIIPGKKLVSCKTFDFYIQPLVEELHKLWENGVWTIDVAKYMGSSFFKGQMHG
jgi:hypothetical protein